ncbi:nucleic acid binding OB-fold tRNA/helicase-type [Methanosalsum zhilinae DSM 4017]|uniref:Nucleic acid binding OB-fold tRNA/helicase-type n=1 Tax=Methanosalsum zhilinae (strain DSM 4017 / NBRC 107636 / OCM 62 / WeN5) TaxID=679901 RepID=F7XPP1_METZD|nr:Single-stranded DNA binding protein [Methanosalsum zhilinae]AEH60311.1 nucleic acid binding OB-fold tRNA/helicase-type [Methanosalsum zhilinae DSM 4017]
MNEKIAPHIEELTRALGISRNQAQKELEILLNYRVPLDEAKRTVIRKFRSSSGSTLKNIGELSPGLSGIDIKGRIINVKQKNVNVKGKRSVIYSGVIADRTGACSFTSWDGHPLNKGDAVHLNNTLTRIWNNRLEINIGKLSSINLLPDNLIPPVEDLLEILEKKIRDIDISDLFVTSTVIILKMYHRNIKEGDREMTIIEGVIGDETGKLPFISRMMDVDIGNVIRFENASVEVFKGLPSINLDENAEVEILDPRLDGILTFESVSGVPEPTKIADILNKNGVFDAVAIGNIISVRPGSGIINRCPECNRVILKNTCRSHGVVDGIKDMRIKIIIDDGTGPLLVMLDRDISETVYGRSMHEVGEMVKRTMSHDQVVEDVKNVLIGKYIAVRGNASRTDFGMILVADSAWFPEDDLCGRIERIYEKLSLLGAKLDV